jgi:ribose transport system substrate-binding protein
MHSKRWLCIPAALLLAIALLLTPHIIKGNNNRLRIGATYMTMNNPFYSVIDEELRLMIESRGDVLLTRDPALDQQRQNTQIRDLLREGIDLLVVNPVDYQDVTPALKDAQAAGVPVVVVDSQVSDPSLVCCTIVSDNYGAGVLCAQHLQRTRQRAQIILLEHPNAKSAIDRIAGFCDTLAANPDYQIIGRADCAGQLELAMPALNRLLEQGLQPNVVMALNDPSAMGVMAALKEHGLLDHVSVYGVDGSPEAKNMIAEGVMTATVAQSSIQIGQATAKAVYQILSGAPYETEIIVPVELVTSENIADFNLEGWQ